MTELKGPDLSHTQEKAHAICLIGAQLAEKRREEERKEKKDGGERERLIEEKREERERNKGQ